MANEVKEKLPFPITKPSPDKYAVDAEDVGYGNGSVKNALDNAVGKTDGISKEATQSEEQAVVFETDGGIQVGKIDATGADFANLKRGGQQVARMSDLPTVPTLDTSIGNSPSNSHIPSTKAVKDYVDANKDGDYPIDTETTSSEDEEQVWENDAETQEYAKIGSYGIKSKAYLDMSGNSIIPTKDTTIGSTPSQTNVPTSKAVVDYVEAHGGGVGDLPISKESTQSEDIEVIYSNGTGSDVYMKVGSYGVKVKTITDLQGNPIGGEGAKGDKGDKGEKGDKGDKGDRGYQGNSGYSGAAGELEIVNNITEGGATAALSAEMGLYLNVAYYNKNLFSNRNIEKTKYYDADGRRRSDGNYYTTDYFPVEYNRYLTVSSGGTLVKYYVVFYNKNKNVASVTSYDGVGSDTPSAVLIDNADVCFARVSANKTYINSGTFQIECTSDGLPTSYVDYVSGNNDVVNDLIEDKSAVKPIMATEDMAYDWYVFGDSWTDSKDGKYKVTNDCLRYWDFAAQNLGLRACGRGVGGSGYRPCGAEKVSQVDSSLNKRNFWNQINNTSFPQNFNGLITIFGSGNDSNTNLGTINDTYDLSLLVEDQSTSSGWKDNNTFYAAVKKTLETVLSKAPYAHVVVLSQCPWEQTRPYTGSWQGAIDCMTVIENCCKLYGIPFVDCYWSSGLRPWDSNQSALWRAGESPHVHPSNEGHLWLSGYIREKIRPYVQLARRNDNELIFPINN